MTIELRPLGVSCNLGCTYCYQEPVRQSGNIRPKYDIDKMLQEVDKLGHNFSLFGGEALLVPKKDLERLWEYGFKKFKSNGIQTNGTLIDDDHVNLFKKYNVSVGISIDGPGELNGLRVVRKDPSDTQLTLDHTQRTLNNVVKLIQNGISVSIIVTLHRLNGSRENLPKLIEFIEWLSAVGVKHGNIHTLEVDSTMPDQEKYVLTQEENIEAFTKLALFFRDNAVPTWMPFTDMRNMMIGDDSSTTCTWHFCDHMNTNAVYGIEGDGSVSNCGRTNKEGIDWYKADKSNYARYISLYNTPDELGGCQGCRFWITCSGSCVGESEHGDFRNKTIHCETMKSMQTFYENQLLEEGIVPVTKLSYRKQIEEYMYDKLFKGQIVSVREAVQEVRREISNVKTVVVDVLS